MSSCIVCNFALPTQVGKGRPRLYCQECVDMGLRESQANPVARAPRYRPEYPASAGEFTSDMPETAVAWRLERLERVSRNETFDRKLLAFKIEHELVPPDEGVVAVSVF